MPASQGTSPTLVFDHQIRVGQEATQALPNYLQAIGEYVVYGSEAFGERQFEGMGDCTDDSTQFTADTSLVGGLVNTAASIAAANFANVSQAITGPTASSYIIPYDPAGQNYITVNTVTCAIKGISAPANVALAAYTIDQNQQVLGPGSFRNYAPVIENNLWYYPLDGNPAIVDVEASGGGDHFYIDVTFSEGIANSNGDPVGMAEFAGAVALVPRTAAYGDDRSSPLAVISVTKPGGAPVEAGDTVIRLRFNEDPATVAAGTSEPNILLSVEPPVGISAADDGTPMHRGSDWWVRAWYDHRAPYITTAEVGNGNAYVDVTFSQAVKFDFSFNSDTQADMTGTTAPESADFVIRYYDRSADMFTTHQPAAIQDFNGADITATPAAGLTELRLVLPPSIPSYGPGDTLDIRTAQRQKNPEHPSLASVFIYGADNLGAPDAAATAEYRKNGKFADTVGNTNFPRTAAFAQVGSLPLKRTLDVTFELGAQDLVIDGTAVEIKVGLFGASAALLAQGEAVTVDVAWQGAAPADVALSGETGITLTSGQPVGTFTAQAGANASDGDTGVLAITAAYDGDAAAAGVTIVADDTLDVRVVQEVPVELTFGVSEAIARIGGETEVTMTLSDAAALGSNRVEVMFAIDPAVPGVTVSPGAISFSRGSMQTVTIAADSSVMTRLSGVNLTASVTAAQQSALQAITPVPVRFLEGTLPVKVLPSFAFEPAADFAGLITDSAPGARLTEDGAYTIVPGTGGRMELDLYAPVMKTGDVYVCVKEDSEATDCVTADDFDLLLVEEVPDGSSTETRTVEVGNFANEVYWAALDGSNVEPLSDEPKKVYVAPPVGFRTSVLTYSSTARRVDVGLAAGAPVTDVMIKIVTEVMEEDLAVRSDESTMLTALGPDSLGAYRTNPSPKVLEIEELNGVTFDAGRFLDPSTRVATLIGTNELLSIGNARVELRPSDLPPSLSFSGLDTFRSADDDFLGTDSFDIILPSGVESQDVNLEVVTVTIHELMPANDTSSPTFAAASSTEIQVQQQGNNLSASWGEVAATLNGLPANSFIEIEADGSIFRMLVTEAGYTAPVGKTRVPGAYAQAEVGVLGDDASDLRLQTDWGIEPLGGNAVSEIATGVYDYLITNLEPGEVVSVVLELAAEVDAAGFVQHKYTEADDWQPFTVTDFDKVYSAPAPCPRAEASRGEADSDAAWRSASGGVREGDGCILLQIQEGGMNDADMTADGVLHDPTALGPGARVGGGGGGAMEPAWLILLAGGMLLSAGLRRRRRPAPSV